jgi:hypothetical protein
VKAGEAYRKNKEDGKHKDAALVELGLLQLPAPAPATEGTPTEGTPTEGTPTEGTPADPTLIAQANAVDAKVTAHRNAEHTPGTTLHDLEEGILAALNAGLKSTTQQARMDIASALMKADQRAAGHAHNAVEFIRLALAELPQRLAPSLQAAHAMETNPNPKPKK